MQHEQQLVAAFHRQIGAPVGKTARLLECDADVDAGLARALRQLIASCRRDECRKSELLLRVLMDLEEIAEWVETHVAGDLIEAADAWADRAYVLMGDAVAAGLPAKAIFAEVHRSNMTKATASKESSKGVRTLNFSPPQIAEILNFHRTSGETLTFPQIGIWWDNGSEIALFSHPAGKPDRYTGLCDSDYAHADLWPEAAMRFGLSEFQDYFSIPRGRVLWDPAKKLSIIYHGNATPQNRLEAVAKEFSLKS